MKIHTTLPPGPALAPAASVKAEIERLRDTMRAIGWQTSDAWAHDRLYEALGEKPSVPQIIAETKE